MNKNQQWLEANKENLAGKNFVITGANSGLGYETAKNLVSWGATVTMACRDLEKAEQAQVKLLKEISLNNRGQIHIAQLDLANLKSIQEFAKTFKESNQHLDVLINNAGVMALPLCRTVQGFEMQIGTNHLGHFFLTSQLLPLLLNTPNARVVTVSSGFHRLGGIRINDLNWQNKYSKWVAYGQSKLANLLFTYELQRRFEKNNLNAIAVAAHPGFASTNLQLKASQMNHSKIGVWSNRLVATLMAQSALGGSLPSTWAATAESVNGGDFYGPSGALELRGLPTKVGSNANSHNIEMAEKLWDLSESLTGEKFQFKSFAKRDNSKNVVN